MTDQSECVLDLGAERTGQSASLARVGASKAAVKFFPANQRGEVGGYANAEVIASGAEDDG